MLCKNFPFFLPKPVENEGKRLQKVKELLLLVKVDFITATSLEQASKSNPNSFHDIFSNVYLLVRHVPFIAKSTKFLCTKCPRQASLVQ